MGSGMRLGFSAQVNSGFIRRSGVRFPLRPMSFSVPSLCEKETKSGVYLLKASGSSKPWMVPPQDLKAWFVHYISVAGQKKSPIGLDLSNMLYHRECWCKKFNCKTSRMENGDQEWLREELPLEVLEWIL